MVNFSFTIGKSKETLVNKINQLYFKYIGGSEVRFDFTNNWAIETAFMQNPDVYAVLMQMASKTATIPYYCKEIADDESYKSYQFKRRNTQATTMGMIREMKSQKQAFTSKYKPIPLEQPNPLMKWAEFFQLYKIYLRATGNVFIYILRNEQNKPIAIYLLPSHLMQIKLRADAYNLTLESPVFGYELIYLDRSVPFLADEVIHIKFPNPSWSFDAQQLFGISPLKSAFHNVENQIDANRHLSKMFKSSGAFGFIFGKGDWLDQNQADQFTERIKEMDESKERMAKISGIAKEIGFQRISLANDELQPWTALAWDRKTICNVLGWMDELMNNDGKASLSSNETSNARKIVLTDNILPDLMLLEESLNQRFIKDFKGYEKYKLCFDISEMPEMQDNIKELLEWADKAPITPNEIRELIKFERKEEPGMDDIWISRGKIRINEAMMTDNFLIQDDEQGAATT
jgi:HK97 family phage portal protein